VHRITEVVTLKPYAETPQEVDRVPVNRDLPEMELTAQVLNFLLYREIILSHSREVLFEATLVRAARRRRESMSRCVSTYVTELGICSNIQVFGFQTCLAETHKVQCRKIIHA